MIMEVKNCKHVRRHAPCCTNSIKVHHKSLYWVSISILKLLLLVTQMQQTCASDVIRVGGIFELVDTKQETSFRQAVVAVNKDNNLLPNTRLSAQIKRIPQSDSYKATKKVCSVIQSGVGAIFGPKSPETSAHIQSICDALEIPHIENRWDFHLTRDEYSVNLYPHPSTLAKAYTEVLKSLGWKTLCVIYENNNGLIRVQELIKDEHFHVSLKQLPLSDDYRPMLKEARKDGVTHIVLDVERENIFTVLKQAQQVGMMTDYHNYFITSLDLHTVDLEDFQYGGTNMAALRLIDPHNPLVQQVIQDGVFEDRRSGRNNNNNEIQTEVALMYDAVQLFAKALDDLSTLRHRIDITPLECDGNATWSHGSTLLDYIKRVSINGLTGLIRFDSEGFRTDVTLDVVQLSKDGLKTIGRWDRTSGVNDTKMHADVQEDVMQSLQDKTLIVSTGLNDPYIMLRDSPKEMTGNDQYEGFCIDLMDMVSNLLGFNYTLVLSPDGTYGQYNQQTNEWTGMIGEVLNLRADLAIGDITITHKREQAVDFSMPWMNLGISILYTKPQRVSPSMFAFMHPFTLEMWIILPFAYLGVALLLFGLARLSPYEQVPGPVVNQFSCCNSLWFIWGSLTQQKTDQQPRATSTRIVSGTWWLFTLILICSYTASLVSFLKAAPAEYYGESLYDVHDLASQTEIKYGAVKGGATMAFFRDSNMPTYQKMFSFMESQAPPVIVDTTAEGIQRVTRESGGYALLMESPSIEYIVERQCNLVQVGGLLDHKSFGFALPPGSPYLALINEAILQLWESGRMEMLKRKWWKQKRGGGLCQEYKPRQSSMPNELGLQNVGGVFVILLAGCGLGSVVAIAEFLWNKLRKPATQH